MGVLRRKSAIAVDLQFHRAVILVKTESACKPGSVVDSHSSGICVTAYLKQPTRLRYGPYQWRPIWSCSERGLPCHELLPVARCALTAPFHPYRCSCEHLGGLLSAALSVSSRLPGVTWRSALWSPDFPPRCTKQHPKELPS
jgi:hypothetical protein